VEEEAQKRVELLIKKRVDSILENQKLEIETEIRKRVSGKYGRKVLLDVDKISEK
jgi:hypothetical protein